MSCGALTASTLRSALATQPPDVKMGEHLVRMGVIGHAALYEGLSLQQGLPMTSFDPEATPRRIVRAIPQHAARQWQVLPFRVAGGGLYVASPNVPSAAMSAALQSFTALEIRFHLTTPAEFEKLTRALL